MGRIVCSGGERQLQSQRRCGYTSRRGGVWGRGQADLAPRAENRSLHPPRRSGNILHIRKCNLLIQPWPSSSVFFLDLKLSCTGCRCPRTGSPRRDKTELDGKSILYSKKMHLCFKGKLTSGEAHALPETRSVHKWWVSLCPRVLHKVQLLAAVFSKVAIYVIFQTAASWQASKMSFVSPTFSSLGE